MFGLIEKKKEFYVRLSWTNTRIKKLKRRASLEFCVHLDMSQIGIVCFTKRCMSGIFKIQKYLKSYRDFTSFSETQAKETCEKGFKKMKNENFISDLTRI